MLWDPAEHGLWENSTKDILNRHMNNVTLHFSQYQCYGGRAQMAGVLPWMDTGYLGKAGQESKEGGSPTM